MDRIAWIIIKFVYNYKFTTYNDVFTLSHIVAIFSKQTTSFSIKQQLLGDLVEIMKSGNSIFENCGLKQPGSGPLSRKSLIQIFRQFALAEVVSQ